MKCSTYNLNKYSIFTIFNIILNNVNVTAHDMGRFYEGKN